MIYLNQLKKIVKKKTTPAVNAGVIKRVGVKREFSGTRFHGHGNSDT